MNREYLIVNSAASCISINELQVNVRTNQEIADGSGADPAHALRNKVLQCKGDKPGSALSSRES